MSITCHKCKAEFTLPWLIDNCHSHQPPLPEPNVFTWDCPSCGSRWYSGLENGRVWLGYAYAAVSAHFAVMEPVSVPDLVVKPTRQGVLVEIHGRRWLKA